MLKVPANFPNPGSYALIASAAPGQTALKAVRILNFEGEGDARVAIVSLLGEYGASGQRRLPAAELLDGTELTEGEKEELVALERRMTGKSRPRNADKQRWEELARRETYAPVLTPQVAKHQRSLSQAA